VVILDEAHRLKSPDAKQTHALYGRKCRGSWIQQADIVWAASGTFVPNHAGELWTHWRALFHESLEHWQWIDRYCLTQPTQWGLRVVGNNPVHLEELKAKIKTHLFRRTQAQVWDQLPRLNWSVQELEGAPKSVLLEERKLGLVSSHFSEGYRSDPKFSTLRRVTGEAKTAQVAAFVADLIDQGRQKILVGFWHTDVAQQIQARLWETHRLTSFLIDGSTAAATRTGRVQVFQEATTPVILLGQIQACGEVICLDRADHVVMAETSWVPGQDLQFAMRAVGMEPCAKPVDLLALTGTLDETIAKTKVRKRRMQSQLLS